MTINKLIVNTRKFAKKEERFRAQAAVNIRMEKISAWPGTKTILFHAVTFSETRHYDTYMFFSDVDFVDKPHPDFPHAVDVGGETYWFEDIYPKHNKVQVRCSCRDFHWTFEWYLNKIKALYQRVGGAGSFKTKGVGPPRNPKAIPGICKHLLALYSMLDKSGVIH